MDLNLTKEEALYLEALLYKESKHAISNSQRQMLLSISNKLAKQATGKE